MLGPMARYVDYGTSGTRLGRCVVLPGRQYTPDGPLLFFATHTALSHGWDVRQVWWEADAPRRASQEIVEEVAWVEGQVEAALGGYDGRALIVAKSLGTLAARVASDRRYPAAWLTPLLSESFIAESLLSYPVEQLVVIGDQDPYLSHEVLDALPGEHLIVPGDHALVVPGDPFAMVAGHDRFVRAFDAWLAAMP